MARFVFYNRNPDGERESDCVTRAISFALDKDYSSIRKKLHHSARLNGCDKLCVCCYRLLLESVFGLQAINCRNMTINDFATLNPMGTYILRIDGHLTCLKNGTVYDIWDCRNEEVTDAWFVR
ncbi:MAG: hypothetical protein IKV81_06505 [Clostridia bacterium]|nr:hypothetical protein [Clostridia bacterium]